MLFLKIFQVILIDFVTKNKKEYNFGVQRVHPLFVLDVCTLLLFFVLEKSDHPVLNSQTMNYEKIKYTKHLAFSPLQSTTFVEFSDKQSTHS
jgi:hypothetical protein